jgi:spermidine/putrescine transport system substrate-binding protein
MAEQLDPFDALKRRYTRRDLLKMSGRGGMSLAALSLLAACNSGTDTGSGPSGGAPSEFPPLAKQLSVAQWPLYIDRAKGGDHPSLQQFTDLTGIVVDYETKINDNQAFFASLTPQLSSGQATGWDLITLSDWVVTRMDTANWLVPMDWSLLPTASQTMLPVFKDPAYDPHNGHSVPWQGGLTGVAYYPDKVGGTITSFDQLWDPKLAGHVGMLTEMVDTFGLTFLSMGVDPQQATADDGQRAADKLRQQRDAGIVRKYYGQDYIDDLARGDLWASMAWSGDIFYYKELGGAPDLEFVVPETGAMIWATCSEIPAGAEHPRDAHAYMDFYYRPEIAALVTDWVLYMTPVKGVQEIMQAKADDPKASAGDRTYYQQLATSPLLFPPEDLAAAKLHPTPVLTEEEFQTFEGQLTSVMDEN